MLFSCSSNDVDSFYDKYKTDPIGDKSFYLGDDVVNISVYGNRIYTAGECVGYYEIDDMSYTKLADIEEGNKVGEYYYDTVYNSYNELKNPPVICANEYGVYYANDEEIIYINNNGEVVTFDVPQIIEDSRKTSIAVYGNDV